MSLNFKIKCTNFCILLFFSFHFTDLKILREMKVLQMDRPQKIRIFRPSPKDFSKKILSMKIKIHKKLPLEIKFLCNLLLYPSRDFNIKLRGYPLCYINCNLRMNPSTSSFFSSSKF